jgi:hypothetical protein
VILGFCAPVCATQYAQAQETKEYLVKAAFIYNFVKFVEWPGDMAIAKHGAIDICVLGESPILASSSVFKAASTAKLSLSLMKEVSLQNVTSHCHVLFVSESENGRMGEILAALKGKPVLTVSDADTFAEQGGMVGFVMSDNKIKVVVNTKSASQSGMRVDAQLLEIALKVIDR